MLVSVYGHDINVSIHLKENASSRHTRLSLAVSLYFRYTHCIKCNIIHYSIFTIIAESSISVLKQKPWISISKQHASPNDVLIDLFD